MTGPRSAYDRWHLALETEAEATSPWHALVREHLKDLAGAHVLEVACGRGAFALWLARQGARRVVAADFSRSAVRAGHALASKGPPPAPRFAVTDITALAFRESGFDLVVSCETIEHLETPVKALREMARTLRPGGLLYLTTPNYLGPMGLYRVYRAVTGRPYTEVGQPINRITLLPRTLGWVRSAGLRVLAVDGVGHYLPFPGRPPLDVPLPRWLRRATRAFALHSLVVAEKPQAAA